MFFPCWGSNQERSAFEPSSQYAELPPPRSQCGSEPSKKIIIIIITHQLLTHTKLSEFWVCCLGFYCSSELVFYSFVSFHSTVVDHGSFKCALEIRWICFALSGRHLRFHEISQLHWTSRWAEVWCVGKGEPSFLTRRRSLSRIWKGCMLLRASTWEDPGFDSAGRERVGASFTVIFFWSHRSSTDIVEAHFTFHLYLLQQKWGLDLGYL